MQILENTNKLINLRESLPEYCKIRLNTGIEGFNSPKSFGVYKKSGGNALGVVGENYIPANLHHFFDTIYQNIGDTNLNIDTLEFNEYKNGSKISFDIKSDDFIVDKSPIIGDVYHTKLKFIAGYDGLTKISLNFATKRLVCLNGAKSYKQDLAISFKNTKGNQGRVLKLTDEIINIQWELKNYQQQLNNLAERKVTQKEIDNFYKDLLGYNYNEYNTLHKKSQNILDDINNAYLIESSTVLNTEFALLNAVTRYNSYKKNAKEEDILFGSGMTMNQKAHQILLN